MNKQDFAVRIPSTFTLVVSINGVMYGFCDAHGDTREEIMAHLKSVRKNIESGSRFYDSLWNDAGSQALLKEELAKATDAIRFDFEGEE